MVIKGRNGTGSGAGWGAQGYGVVVRGWEGGMTAATAARGVSGVMEAVRVCARGVG